MADVFTVAGTPLDLTADDFLPAKFTERFGTIPTLTLHRRGVALPALPDPWMGKEVTWVLDGTLRFTGDVVSVTPNHTAIGWVLVYQCLGRRNRLDFFPHTDANTGIDTSAYNLTLDDPSYNAARAGRTVGQILTDILTMTANATAINGYGLGGYTSLSPPTLPAATVTDLATLTIIPQRPVYFTGEKFGSALDGFMSHYAPNHRLWINPQGVIRILDLRTFVAQTLTMGTDPIEPSELSRDVGDCFQRVVVRGQPIAIMAILKLSNGDLTEQFVWGPHATNAAAKAAWTPADFRQPGSAQVIGTCTCPTTTTVTVDPTDASVSWPADHWDQSHQMGTINTSSTVITNYTQFWSGRIITSPALTAGGTTTLTIDNPLPHTNFDKFTITGLAGNGSVVWTQYQIANADIRTRVTKQSTYPQPFINAGGGVTMISTSMGAVLWSASGSPPYNSFPLAFTYNASTGMVRFIAPTYIIANNAAPADVWVAVPVFTNPLQAIRPPDSGGPVYAGTSSTVDGRTETLTITMEHWRDPGQLSQVEAFAADILDSVKDAVVEGSVVYYGKFEAALTFGLALSIAGNDGAGAYNTMGWNALALPVVQVDVEWPQDEGMDMRTTMRVSNRRAHLSAEMFLHPERSFLPFGSEFGLFGEAEAFSTPFVTPGDIQAAAMPGETSIPTNPADYFASQGIATNPGDFMRSNGLSASPGDMGLPMTPGDLRLPTSPMDVLGGTTGAGGMDAGGDGFDSTEGDGLRSADVGPTPGMGMGMDAFIAGAPATRQAPERPATPRVTPAAAEAPADQVGPPTPQRQAIGDQDRRREEREFDQQATVDFQGQRQGGRQQRQEDQERVVADSRREQDALADARREQQAPAMEAAKRQQDTRREEREFDQQATVDFQGEAKETRQADQAQAVEDAKREQDALAAERQRQREETMGG